MIVLALSCAPTPAAIGVGFAVLFLAALGERALAKREDR